MSIEQQEDFKGEKYYNKTTLTIYCVVIAFLLIDIEPDISLMKLLVGIGFTVAWTYVAGAVACIALLTIINALFPKSHLDKFIGDYLLWLVPASGFSFFFLAYYG
ncbi:hypothetical protein ACSL9C_000716 [Vibrio navarrensis]